MGPDYNAGFGIKTPFKKCCQLPYKHEGPHKGRFNKMWNEGAETYLENENTEAA